MSTMTSEMKYIIQGFPISIRRFEVKEETVSMFRLIINDFATAIEDLEPIHKLVLCSFSKELLDTYFPGTKVMHTHAKGIAAQLLNIFTKDYFVFPTSTKFFAKVPNVLKLFNLITGKINNSIRFLDEEAHIDYFNFLIDFCQSWNGLNVRFIDNLIRMLKNCYVMFPDRAYKLDCLVLILFHGYTNKPQTQISVWLGEHETNTNLIELLKLYKVRFAVSLNGTTPIRRNYEEVRIELFKKFISEGEESNFPYNYLNHPTTDVHALEIALENPSERTGQCKVSTCHYVDRTSNSGCIKCLRILTNACARKNKSIRAYKSQVSELKAILPLV